MLKTLIAAAAIALSPLAAQAAMIEGQLDIVGVVNVQTSTYEAGGNLDFDQDAPGNRVNFVTGDFADYVSVLDVPTLFDLNFTAPETVYSVGGFVFQALSFFDFDNTFPGRGFAASGTITGNGFDATPGLLTFSTQTTNSSILQASFSSTTTPVAAAIPLPASALMLLTAFGGLGGAAGLMRRRKSRAA